MPNKMFCFLVLFSSSGNVIQFHLRKSANSETWLHLV